MNNKFYVSLKAARLLKEKGYDRECVAYYQHGTFYPYAINTQRELSITNKNAAPAYMEQYSAPTKAETIDWLESKGMVIDVRYDYHELQKDDSQWIYYIYQYDNEGQLDEMVFGWVIDRIYDTRLEAEDAAIIKALELL